MKGCLFILCCILFIPNLVFGQQHISIVSSDGKALPGAKFEASSVLDSIHKIRHIANMDGVVQLEATSGVFFVCVSYLGFDSYRDTVEILQLKRIVLQSPQLIGEMVVTAQSEAVSVENAVQKVTVITSDQIQKSGANNLADILTYQTGIRLSQDNVLGSSMDLGGISGQNVKILVDGVPVIGRQNGNVDLSQINLNNVERIEVIEGPLSVNYGTNALAGTVNIITKKKGRQGVSVEILPYYETIGNYNLTGLVSFSKKRHHVSIDGGRNYFDGWTNGDAFIEFPKERLADTNRVKTWKPKEQYFGGVRYSFLKENWQLSAFGKYFDEMIVNRGMPSAPYYEAAFDDYYHTQRLDAGLTNEFRFKNSKLNVLVAYNDYKRIKNTYLKDLTTLNQVLAESVGAQDTSRFNQFTGRLIYSGELGKKLTYQLGADVNQSSAWGRRIDSGQQTLGDYAGFVTVDWKLLDSLTIKPGIRYAYNTTYASPLVPSLNVLYRVKRFSFRASAARGFRSPDLKELYMDFVDVNHNITGNQNLHSEDSWNFSLFVNWMKLTKKNALLKLEYGGYYNDIENLITLGIVDNSTYTYINIGKYSTIGQQLSFIYRSQRWRLNLNATYIGRYNPDSEIADVDRYSFSPELGARINYVLIKGRLQTNVFYKYNGQLQSFYIGEDNSVETTRQSDYHILDASITADFFKQEQLSVTLGAKNILNVKQVNVIGQNQGGVHSSGSTMNGGRGISFFLSVRYRINFKMKKDEK